MNIGRWMFDPSEWKGGWIGMSIGLSLMAVVYLVQIVAVLLVFASIPYAILVALCCVD